MLLRRTCREAATLMIAREDRALRTTDRVALRLHLLACGACSTFERQVFTLRHAMRNWRNAAASDEADGRPPAS